MVLNLTDCRHGNKNAVLSCWNKCVWKRGCDHYQIKTTGGYSIFLFACCIWFRHDVQVCDGGHFCFYMKICGFEKECVFDIHEPLSTSTEGQLMTRTTQ